MPRNIGSVKISTAILLTAVTAAATPAQRDFAFGVLAEARGDDAAAANFFESARLADPVAVPLVQRAVAARMAAGERGAAVTLYRDLAAARPDDLGVQFFYSDFLDAQSGGDSLALKLSEETLLAALAKHPGHPEIIRRLFQHAQAADDDVRQAELLEQLPPGDPAAALLYASLSKAMADGKEAAAVAAVSERLQAAFNLHPEDPEMARTLSENFREAGNSAEAIATLEHHVEAAPWSLELRTRLGVLYFTAKRDAEGETTLQEVLTISPQHALAHQALAKFYRLHDQPGPARVHASELMKIRGGSVGDFLKLADEWLAANDPRQARLLLERAIFAHPTDYEVANLLAIATRRDPETRDQSARLFREAEALRPADVPPTPEFMLESAEALLDQGQTKAAEEQLRNAIRAFPAEAKKETAVALRRLAGIWEAENRNGDAARALRQRADSLDP